MLKIKIYLSLYVFFRKEIKIIRIIFSEIICFEFLSLRSEV